MIKKIPNPFAMSYGDFNFEDFIKSLTGQIQQTGNDIRGQLNSETIQDWFEVSYDASNQIWSYLLMMAFKDDPELEVIDVNDLPIQFQDEVIDDVIQDTYIPLKLLPLEIREELIANHIIEGDSLTDASGWTL